MRTLFWSLVAVLGSLWFPVHVTNQPACAEEILREPLRVFGIGAVLDHEPSPDGKYLATCSARGLFLWDAHGGSPVRELGDKPSVVCSVAFSPSGALLAAGYGEGEVRLWDVSSGDCIRTLRVDTGEDQGAATVLFSPCGTLLATGYSGGDARLWEVETGRCRQIFRAPPDGIGSRLAFSANGSTVAAGIIHTDDPWRGDSAAIWDVATGRLLSELPKQKGRVGCMALSPSGDRALTSTTDSRTKLWDTRTGACLREREAYCNQLVFSRDGQHAFVPNPENGIEMWEAATGKTLRTFAGRSGLLGVSHAGDLLLSGNMGTIELWITTSGKCVQTIDCRRPVRSATFWPGGKAVLVMLADNTLVLRNLEDGAYLFAADTHNGGVEGIAIARAGQRLAALHRFQITVWDVQSGKRLRALPLDELHLRPFAVSPDGTLAVVGNEQGVVRLLSLDTGESIRTFKHDDRYVGSAVFHPDGNRLITSTSDTVRIWRLDSGECLFTLRNHRKGRGCLALSPDASRLASGAGLGVDVWDTDSGVLTQSMDFGSSNVYVVFTPDGRSLLTLCPLDHVLKWWDMGTGQATRTVPLETDTKGQIVLQGPTWSADFTRLLTVPGPNKTGKETVREWDTLTGKCLRSLPIQLVRHVWVSRYLPDGEHFVTGSYDGTLMLW